MHKIISIAVASIIALSSANAEQQSASKQQNENEPIATDAGSAATSESANRNVIIGVVGDGSAPTSAVSGTIFSQSSMRAPALIPVTPFAPYTVADPAASEELQSQMKELNEREQRMLQNPEYRDLLRARQRVALSHMHGDLRELLQISKEQADQLLDLLAEQQVREQAASRPTWPHGDPAAMQALMEKAQERQRTNDDEIAALLGPSKLQEWKEYEQSALARFQVQRLRQMLPPDAALRAEQLRPLVTAISREQRQMFEDRSLVGLAPSEVPDENWQRRMQERHLEQTAARNQRILDAASPILSPKQLEYLTSLLQEEIDAQSRGQVFFGRMAPLVPSNPQQSKEKRVIGRQ